jgi:hypothetical protein
MTSRSCFRDFTSLAVSVDEKKEDASTIVKNARWTSVSVCWAGPDVLQQYLVAGLPTVFVIDQKGNVAAVDHRLDIASIVAKLLKEPSN